MRKQKLVLILVIILFLSQNIYSQCNISNTFPLKIGNIFYFKNIDISYLPYHNITTYYSCPILKDSVMNSHRYFYMSNYSGYSGWWRVDSLTGNLFTFDSANSCPNYYREILFDSLCVSSGDSVNKCGTSTIHCTSNENHTLFNQSNESRHLFASGGVPGLFSSTLDRIYDAGFGLVVTVNTFSGLHGIGGNVTTTLIGCKINGVVYGDTNTVSVQFISSNIPSEFSLHQNYPNPFNPSTVIRYQLSVAGFTTLRIFDLLGKEVATLVNEKQNAGSYAVDFNSSEFNLPSGIYFYTLNAGEFKQTRKMVLVK
ncbi:MAG: T9SS type A sorting domain-containing protein [Bacteroidetes bacterium]|nr:T9SS type A sorting domain-containing protein [Bacteroidota bacterium]